MIFVPGYSAMVAIGHGGLGDVYRAISDATGETVAVKVARHSTDASAARRRMEREFAALSAIAGHPHVIGLVEMVSFGPGLALVMEFAAGGSVADLMSRRDEALTVEESALIGLHTASALVAVHSSGIVHQDVKPQNLLLDAWGRVRICDFGIADLTGCVSNGSRTTALSLRYASPEQLDDSDATDSACSIGPGTDIYSLGATLLHIARGAPPTLRERIVRWVPPAGAAWPIAGLDTVIAACLAPQPGDRPTAAEVVVELSMLAVIDDGIFDVTNSDESVASPTITESTVEAIRCQPILLKPPTAITVPTTVVAPTTCDGIASDAAQPTVAVHRRFTPPRTQVDRVGAVLGGLAVAFGCFAGAGVLTSFGGTHEQPLSSKPIPSQRIDTLTPVERSPGLVELSTLDWPTGPVGGCLVQLPGSNRMGKVDCASPHDLQRFAIGRVADAGVHRSSQFELVGDFIRSECEREFAVFVGRSPWSSRLQIAISSPVAATWGGTNLAYQCLLGIRGHRLVGDAAGADR